MYDNISMLHEVSTRATTAQIRSEAYGACDGESES